MSHIPHTGWTKSSMQSAELRTAQVKGIVTYPPHRVDSVQHTVCSIVDNKGRVLLSRIPHTGWTQSSTQSAALWTTREGYCCHISPTQGGLSPAHSLQHCGQQGKGTVVKYPPHRVDSVQHTVCSIVDNSGKKDTTVSSRVLNLSLQNDAELKTGIPE